MDADRKLGNDHRRKPKFSWQGFLQILGLAILVACNFPNPTLILPEASAIAPTTTSTSISTPSEEPTEIATPLPTEIPEPTDDQEEVPLEIEVVDWKEVEKIQNNIEAFMNVPQAEMESYIETYGWRIKYPGENKKLIAPQLSIVGDRSIPNQDNYAFTFLNIAPNLGILDDPELSVYEPVTRMVSLQGVYLGQLAVKDVNNIDRNFIIVGHDIGGRRFVNTVYASAFTPEEDLSADNMVVDVVNLPPNSHDQQRAFTMLDGPTGQSSEKLPTLVGNEGMIVQYLIISGPGIHANIDIWGDPTKVSETDLRLIQPNDDPEYVEFANEIAPKIAPGKPNASVLSTLQAQRLHETMVAMYVEDAKRLGLSANVPGVDLNLIGNNPDQEILDELSFDALVNTAMRGPLTGMSPWKFTSNGGWKILQDEPLFTPK